MQREAAAVGSVAAVQTQSMEMRETAVEEEARIRGGLQIQS
jgi:hypothetical protein